MSGYRSPTQVWHDFTAERDPEDGVKEHWLPDSARPMSSSAKARLTEWYEAAKKPKVKEDGDQHPAFHDLIRLSLSATTAEVDRVGYLPPLVVEGVGKIVHCIYTTYLSGLSPDFSLFPIAYSRSAAACAFNIELQLGTLDPEHKQRALTYNALAMQANPSRLFTLTAVTNLRQIMFVRTSRASEGSDDFDVRYSIEYEVLDAGWELLLSIIRSTEWTGQFLPSLTCDGHSIEILEYLGAGVSSTVWTGQIKRDLSAVVVPGHWSNAPVVCKTFTQEDMFERELRTWVEIDRRIAASVTAAVVGSTSVPPPTRLIYRSSSRAQQQLAVRAHSLPSHSLSSSPSQSSKSSYPLHPPRHTLFFTPVGVRQLEDCKSQDAFRDMFSCLFGLRQLNIVHRDLTPRHFLRCDGDKSSASRGLFLIDFGFAVPLPESAEARQAFSVPFCGSSHFAPTPVLAELAKKVPLTYKPLLAHDLESLVKVCFARRFADDVESLRKLDSNDADKIYDFWVALESWIATAESRGCWLKALQHARNDEFDETRKAIELDFAPLVG